MLDQWQLNAIVLQHIDRFFGAAQQAVQAWSPNDDALIGGLGTLVGNLLWARSHFEAPNQRQEEQMATTGAVVSSLADRVVQGQSGTARARALVALAEVERALRTDYDALLETVMGKLREQKLLGASPATVNAAAWSVLFPDFPASSSQPELVAALAARLQSAG